MATEAGPVTRWLADEWENNCGYASAVLSGIVPDERHLRNGGYHCSVEDLRRFGNAGDYSNRRRLDKAPPVSARGRKLAAAVDMSLSVADMKKLYSRAKRMYDDRSDPRRKWLNAINVWDGIAGHAPRRLDFQANTNSTADRSHTWHSHQDQPRSYVDVYRKESEAWTAARAFISMVKGESRQQWLASQSGAAAVAEPEIAEEDAMSIQTLTPGYAFGADGGLLDVTKVTVLSLPPVGAPGRSGTMPKNGYLSFSMDAVGVVTDVNLRVAFHNGKIWEVVTIVLTPGARVPWRGAGKPNEVNAADIDGSTVSVGRIRRLADTDDGADVVPVSVLFEQY